MLDKVSKSKFMYERKTKTCKKCGKRRPLSQYARYTKPEDFTPDRECPMKTCWACRNAEIRRIQRAHSVRTNHATSRVGHAIKTGKLVRQECCVCERLGIKLDNSCYKSPIHGHHCDYRKPLEVLWLCLLHHQGWHRVFKTEDKQD